ncbi:MAG: adenylosuccinate lyase [Pirellulaceae bacterium]|nr:adenylosuccinate lyase [Pirellulaceae bacterium]
MADSHLYENPLITRYASKEMAGLWSTHNRTKLWRKLWVVLAECQRELGLAISEGQIAELKSFVDQPNLEVAAKFERELRHDVMAHIHAYGEQAPGARGIIHLGATSCYVTDNADLILMREALQMIASRLGQVIITLGNFAKQYRALPCLAFTHLQAAQPTTVGKRACLWAYDLAIDLQEIEHRLETLRARSVKGTTGTQASFLELFAGDHAKVRQLESMVAQRLGFSGSYAVTGQTYPRKIDSQIVDSLSGVGQSLHKIATDLRLLAHRKEVDEPFEKQQIGSSAMPYKRNPMRSERICSLARFVMSLQTSTAATASVQWLERTLDDSANRRLVLPQSFLGIDACLILMQNVAAGLDVYEATITKNLLEELPFMASENIMMAAVAAGADRQEIHEQIRQHSVQAGRRVKSEGASNDLMQRLAQDPHFAGLKLAEFVDPAKYVGRAPEQVDEFLAEIVAPIHARYDRPLPPTELRV